MGESLLQIKNINKSFGNIKAINELSIVIERADKIVLIFGPNGAGKTVLFNIITGYMQPDSGIIRFQRLDLLKLRPYEIANAGIARTFQNTRLIFNLSVLENILLSFREQPGEKLRYLFANWNDTNTKRTEIRNKERAFELLDMSGMFDKAASPAGTLSYGQQKLLSIICCIASEAKLLLLDEPLSGIAPEKIEQVISVIKRLPERGKTAMVIEHNLEAIENICDKVIFLDSGIKKFDGSPIDFRNDPDIIKSYLV